MPKAKQQQLSEKQLEIMSFISNLRVANTLQLHALFGYGGTYGIKVTRRKLLELEKMGYLHSWQPSRYDAKIYYLTKQGADEVAFFTGRSAKLQRKSDKTEHQVGVTEVYTRLRLEESWKVRRFAIHSPIGDGFTDSFVELDLGEGRRKLFFLEVDMGTESLSYVRDIKLKNYEHVYHLNTFQNQFGIFPDVIFICDSPIRQRSLITVGEQFSFKVKVFSFDEITADPKVVV